MAKVQHAWASFTVEQAAKRRVTWHKPMVVMSLVIAINVASMPLKAFFSESFPWQVEPRSSVTGGVVGFDQYNQTTLARVQSFYTAAYLVGKPSIFIDRLNATTFMRSTLWFDDVQRPCSAVVPTLPGAFFYGSGFAEAICAFLDDPHPSLTTGHCHHIRQLGFPLAEQCVWLVRRIETGNVQVYQTMQQWQNKVFLWLKLVFRLVLTAYVCREMYVTYYRHYATLAESFLRLGLKQDPSVVTFEIYVGDPTSIILSNPWVSLAFVVDFWLNADSVGMSMLQISQVESLVDFFIAVVYCLRSVWFAYFVMRYSTYFLKRYHLEHRVVPLDPTVVALGVVVYVAPLMYFSATTPLMYAHYFLWEVAVSADEYGQAIEVLPGVIFDTIGMGAILVLFSLVLKGVHPHRRDGPTARNLHNLLQFNDLKQRVAFDLLGLKRRFTATQFEGGTMYNLHLRNARFNRMPLFSLRGSDCFVLCYSATNELKAKLRLSLWRNLDLSDNRNDGLTIHVCNSPHDECVSRVNSKPCGTFQPACPTSLCLHRGDNASPWMV